MTRLSVVLTTSSFAILMIGAVSFFILPSDSFFSHVIQEEVIADASDHATNTSTGKVEGSLPQNESKPEPESIPTPVTTNSSQAPSNSASAPTQQEPQKSSPIIPPPPVPTPKPITLPGYHRVMTTIFWVGEPATADNGYIANSQSAWDGKWKQHFGGFDDPDDRCGYRPCDFTPKENPFYYALPYTDLDWNDNLKPSAKTIPWYTASFGGTSLVKNHWIEVVYKGKKCYGQWEDVGPYETDDFSYVFGSSKPKNTFGLGAGLDISPALRDCLALSTNDYTEWRFVDAGAVPSGPWKEIVTTSDVTR